MISLKRLLAVLFAFFMLIMIYWVFCCLQWTSYRGSGGLSVLTSPLSIVYFHHYSSFDNIYKKELRWHSTLCASSLCCSSFTIPRQFAQFLYHLLFKRPLNLRSFINILTPCLLPNSGNASDSTLLLQKKNIYFARVHMIHEEHYEHRF